MENSEFLPNQQPNTNFNKNTPKVSIEYITPNPKKKKKLFIEIGVLVVILTIPVVLSFFKIDYSISRVYQVVSPADIGTLPSTYNNWNTVIKAAKKLTQPIVAPNQPTPTPTPMPTSTSLPTNYPTSQQKQNTNQIYETQTEEAEEQTEIIEETEEEIIYPTLTPTNTPTPGVDAYVVACYDKEVNDKCYYYASEYDITIHGRCKSYGGTLYCISYGY